MVHGPHEPTQSHGPLQLWGSVTAWCQGHRLTHPARAVDGDCEEDMCQCQCHRHCLLCGKDEAHEQRLVFVPTPWTLAAGTPPSTVTTPGLAPARPEEGYGFCLVSIVPGLALALG